MRRRFMITVRRQAFQPDLRVSSRKACDDAKVNNVQSQVMESLTNDYASKPLKGWAAVSFLANISWAVGLPRMADAMASLVAS